MEKAQFSVGVSIPEIHSDSDLVCVIDYVKHSLKSALPYTTLQKDFNKILNTFITKHNLDTDKHNFAVLPFAENCWNCGSQPIIQEGISCFTCANLCVTRYVCPNCNSASTSFRDSKKEALAMWNRSARAQKTKQRKPK